MPVDHGYVNQETYEQYLYQMLEPQLDEHVVLIQDSHSRHTGYQLKN
jgi:hypothetical protein